MEWCPIYDPVFPEPQAFCNKHKFGSPTFVVEGISPLVKDGIREITLKEFLRILGLSDPKKGL